MAKEVSAGGVVYRRTKDNKIELMIIEDRYLKASLPKGKQEEGETMEETALREIKEETGIEGKVVQPLETIYYNYYHPKVGAVKKEVHYYLVEAMSGTLAPQLEEINTAVWMSPEAAWEKQTKHGYQNNISVLAKAYQLLGLSTRKGQTS
ncbi:MULTISPECIES: NUDIX hydrolase [Aneurinibacillus]|jgi:8-oxo-dGTP pyrophosphatase MutT (NUDIX family)|uniref:NUDIX domain-containing protein n=1 Tax=Aneurinibacillus thermoaerophilus TaxID=143495 RepID=A0A1G7Z615_ANETH|nr:MULTISPECIES: NUDIX hydrolase [Aneurinibacillus]AMA72336.1 NTP pyrophosphohydrolase [Aneurinibacillus sp. XH2]MED0674811.1 NUDIX hydrolase [Aneurinibacillus thermoaerophilus]MED0679761.1 NUDIX hydrolase [Aneurinibacillus thermoaerophilus]MED0735793.1 NUDIX hydrolase [Aneurinibacillus thermoaerophilus]MED0758001.1 NUDIX hydrolase [Aneurinibacillus thermoaerophilus]